MVKVLEQLKWLTGRTFMKYFTVLLIGLSLLQVSCATNGEIKNIAHPTPTIEIVDKNRIEETSNSTLSQLNSENLFDISKLIEQFNAATSEDKETAKFLFNESKKEYEKEKYTSAGQGFIESIIVFPRVDSLIMSGESIARLDVKDQPKNEVSSYKLKQFKESAEYFELAIKFANKTQQTTELEKYPNLNNNIACLNNFIINKSNKEKGCEFINDILKANNILEFNK